MSVFRPLNERAPREERKIEQICENFDMDCVDLDHESCWLGIAGTMPCCGLTVEFEKARGICPFLML